VVLERVGGRGVDIIDPACGRRSVTTTELRRSFTGVALLLEPGETFEPMAAPRKSAWRYLQEVLRESGLWVRISVMSVLSAGVCPRAANTDRSARGSRCPEN
jgi:ABC-type bacteriocin/lantibiotic exporter with double-glycine peptidase domain